MSTDPLSDPDLLLSEIMQRWPASVEVFLEFQMLCVGCLVAPFHTISDTCIEHGVDEEKFRARLAEAMLKEESTL